MNKNLKSNYGPIERATFGNIDINNKFSLKIELAIKIADIMEYEKNKKFKEVEEVVNLLLKPAQVVFNIPRKTDIPQGQIDNEKDYNFILLNLAQNSFLREINLNKLIEISDKISKIKEVNNISWQIYDNNSDKLFTYNYNKYLNEIIFEDFLY